MSSLLSIILRMVLCVKFCESDAYCKSMKFYTPQKFICVQYSQLTAQSNIVNTSNFIYGGLSMVYYKV